MEEEIIIKIGQTPIEIQLEVAKENCECLKEFGGEYDGYLWHEDGMTVIAFKLGHFEIIEILSIGFNKNFIQKN